LGVRVEHLFKSRRGPGVVVEVTPEIAGWQYLGFKVMALKAGETYREQTEGKEVALVPLDGKGRAKVARDEFELDRHNIFAQVPHLLYVPPRQELVVTALTDFVFSTGSALAEGKYPVRLFDPGEMRQEIRGGGAARRQVNHILAHPLPAERLILYEVYVPGGMWSGWPPHAHDGEHGSPYLEETYYYRFQPENGYAIQRNYRDEAGFDEFFAVHDGDLTLVTRGFHPVVATPGSNMYFLNYQAGDLVDEARKTPPYDDPEYVWIRDNWDKNVLQLPIGRALSKSARPQGFWAGDAT
jgi:5-deoxy-glucuronate isomerase